MEHDGAGSNPYWPGRRRRIGERRICVPLSALRQAGLSNFRITGITSRTRRDAESFVKRDAGPRPRPPVSSQASDPLSVHDIFVSDFQPEGDAEVYDSLEGMLAAGAVDALDILGLKHVHPTAATLHKARRGSKHWRVQEPLAMRPPAGRAMVQAAQQRR